MLKFSTLSLLHPKFISRSLCTKKAWTPFFFPSAMQKAGKRKGEILMKSHKTPLKERGIYTYHFDDCRKVTIKPGQDGVTEEFIKQLHALDDSEVYYNNKNWHRPVSEKEKMRIKEWEEKHSGEKYSDVWNLSLDSVFEEDGSQDKCIYLADNRYVDDVISALANQLPNDIPVGCNVQFRLTNCDSQKEAVYVRSKGKGF